jgi:phenylalanyl-tRNA synthetase beta chain
LHPALLAELDLRGPAVLFEIWLEQIPLPKKQAGSARSLLDASPLQPLTKDFAFVVDESVAAEALLRAVKAADKRLISAVSLFDIYRGAGVPEGQKSLAVEVTLQPRTASLTDADLDALSQSVIKAAQKATGAVLRS